MKISRRKSMQIMASLLFVSVLFSGCGSEQTASETKYAEIADTQSIDDTPVKDNSLLYKNEDQTSIKTMYLTVRKGNESDHTNHTWNEINSYSTYYYDENDLDRYQVEGTLQVGNESGPQPGELGYGVSSPNATVKVRGKSSSKSPQKSYQIKLKKDKGTWNDQTTIDLNKHVFDPTRFRNKLSYDLMTQYPSLLSARTQFVHLYICDLTEGGSEKYVDYGLFTQVEQINKRYLRNHGLDENGQLYKASMFEFLQYTDALKLAEDKDYNLKEFEKVLEIKGSDDHSKLMAMLKELNDYTYPIEDIVAKYFDEENYFTWLAFQMITGNTDTCSQNFFLYSPLNGNKWYFISWDNDGAWDHLGRMAKSGGGYNYQEGISNYWGAVLHQRVLKSDTLRAKLLEKIDYFHKELTKEKITDYVNKYKAVVEPFAFTMPDINHEGKTKEGYQTIVSSMSDEVEYNYQMIKESLTRPMPFYTSTPAINGNTIRFAWDNAYDFNNEKLTYTFELSTDYTFKTALAKKSDIFIPGIDIPLLPDGQYFYRITASNESLKTQTSMNFYQDINELKHFGVCSFFVEKGKILQG